MFREIGSAFSALWQWLGNLRDAILSIPAWLAGAFKEILGWFQARLNDLLIFVRELFEGFWDLLAGLFQSLYESAAEWYMYYLKRVARYCWDSADWLIGVAYDFLIWLIDQMPPLDLPEGFESGLAHAVSYGMQLDRFVPISEAFILLGLYVQLVVALIVYRQTRKFLPFLP